MILAKIIFGKTTKDNGLSYVKKSLKENSKQISQGCDGEEIEENLTSFIFVYIFFPFYILSH